MSTALLCARQELLIAVRSRWLQIFVGVFAALALLVAGSGYVLSGGYGVQDFARTAESLLQLVLLLVPLTALTFGALTLTQDRGTAELLYSQPVSRAHILCGRVCGLVIALAAAQSIGFGVAGLVVQQAAGGFGIEAFMVVVGTSLALTVVFVSLAALISQARPGRRARVLAVALVVWFVAVVLYDVAVLGVASLLRSGTASRLLMTAALANPVDAARTAALMGIEGTAAFAAASLALLRFTGGVWQVTALAATSVTCWAVIPLVIAARRLKRADV